MSNGLNLNLDGSAMQAIVAAAIMQQVGPEKRDELMLAAIKYLMDSGPKRNSWDPTPKSPLQESFERAAYGCAQEIIREEFAKPEYRARLQEVVSAAMNKALEGEPREEMIRRLAGALSTALTKAE